MTSNVQRENQTSSSVAVDALDATSTPDTPNGFEVIPIPRSASYAHVPSLTQPNTTPDSVGIKRTFSENVLANPKANAFRQSFIRHGSGDGEEQHEYTNGRDLVQRQSTRSATSPKITVSKFTLATDQSTGDAAYEPNEGKPKVIVDHDGKLRSVSGTLSSLARKSWISASRSPSPNKRENPKDGSVTIDRSPSSASSGSRSVVVTQSDTAKGVAEDHIMKPLRRSSFLGKKSRRPLSAFLGRSSPEPRTPPVPSIPKSYSTGRLPSLMNNHSSSEKPPVMPKSLSSERLQAMGMDFPRRKDELWTNFRALDGDFQKSVCQARLKSLGNLLSLNAYTDFNHEPALSRLVLFVQHCCLF